MKKAVKIPKEEELKPGQGSGCLGIIIFLLAMASIGFGIKVLLF